MKQLLRHLTQLFIFSMIALQINAQEITQTIKGTVLDKASEKPLEGATISIEGNAAGTTSDANGKFTLRNVPIGRQKVIITYKGYKPILIPEVLVTSGKEVILDAALEQSIAELGEVTVSASKVKKGAATNEYVTGSNRSFNVDEVTRFAGGRNDPSKLVSNFAGVVSNNDSRNDIVVRGNSPAGVLWRIEGLPAPSPNHYATLGTTGGPVSALNTNALKTSDFLTGAFPAEFGNATAAVFDINLRTGNPDKHERTLQLNLFSGAEVMLEGPLSKKKNGSSYLVGYRYSFVQIASSIGLNVGTSATPNYQDWVYNINFGKGKAGAFSLYGMGGISTIDFIGEDVDTTDFFARKDQDSYSTGNFSVFGAKHTLDVGKKSYLRTSVSYSTVKNDFDDYQYPLPFQGYNNRYQITSSRNQQNTLRFSSYFNSKINARTSWRAGVTGEQYALETKVLDKEGKSAADNYDVIRDFDDNFLLMQYFAQVRYKPTDKLTFNAGLHGNSFTFNNTSTIEPRASLTWQASGSDQIYVSYGLHSQLQPFPVYLYEQENQDGSLDRSNRDLDFTMASHYVVGYEKRFAGDWRFKVEGYYQSLTNVPVENRPTGFSMLNSGSDFTFPDKGGLVNDGTGSNIGVELTLEKFLSKGYYLLITSSIFDSKYEGSDGIERNSSFNYGNVLNVLAGKEWKVGSKKKNAFTTDFRVSSIGGKYATPVDLNASIAANKEVLDEARYNTDKLAGYFRADIKFGYRINSSKRKMSQTIYLDFQNVTARENVFLQRYNPERRTVGAVNQIGF
ncbi:MAG: TonB-dependent receptor, partial [Chitinophagaceae bacterium]|nr:TonB-dependent receptor [Chitinophagaceae bacterium]